VEVDRVGSVEVGWVGPARWARGRKGSGHYDAASRGAPRPGMRAGSLMGGTEGHQSMLTVVT
jgi:hypothetical protein